MESNLYILENEASAKIYNSCSESLNKKEISQKIYGKWLPNAVLPKIRQLEKAGYLKFDEIGRNPERKRGKYLATYKPFFDFLEENGIVLSPEEEHYISMLIENRLKHSKANIDEFSKMLNMVLEDTIICQLFDEVLVKQDASYKLILPYLKRYVRIENLEDLIRIQIELREKCQKKHNKKPKKYERIAHMRCDILFSHLLIPESLQLKIKSDLIRDDFRRLIQAIDTLRYRTEYFKKN